MSLAFVLTGTVASAAAGAGLGVLSNPKDETGKSAIGGAFLGAAIGLLGSLYVENTIDDIQVSEFTASSVQYIENAVEV